MKPENRTESLLHFFGWQGGTIHQLSEVTGVDSNSLLYDEPNQNILDTSLGWYENRTCNLAHRLSSVEKYRGNTAFWLGAATAGKENFNND